MGTIPQRLGVEASGIRLDVEFVRDLDRFAHRIAVSADGRARILLQSVEGSADAPWPPSPPLQQLAIEPREASDVALAVGMSGSSHWSFSVQTLRDPLGLEFDVACRTGPLSPAGSPGSVYRWCDVSPVETPPGGAGTRHGIVFPGPGAPVALEPLEGSRIAWGPQGTELSVRPEGPEPQALWRWRYRIYLP